MILIFDWGDTLMRDFPDQPGPMADWAHVEWIPGAEKALAGLSSAYFCAVATNAGASDTALMKKALARVGADAYLSFFTSSKDLCCEKPDPLFFLKIASILGVRPEECIHVGNIYEKDIIGASAAGMHTIFFNEQGRSGDFREASRVIQHMDDLAEAVASIQASQQWLIEACCDSLQSAMAAERGGANRIELCAGLQDGGLTPSIGTVMSVLKEVRIPVNVLIRPRPGNFCYDARELKSMIRDIEFLRKAGIQGVVSGALRSDGQVDEAACRELMAASAGLDTTFHRAFDVAADRRKALPVIVTLGYKRVLTSGGKPNALEGIEEIARCVAWAGNSIRIMPGAGIREDNIREIARLSGAREFHMSLRDPVAAHDSLEGLSGIPLMQTAEERFRTIRKRLTETI